MPGIKEEQEISVLGRLCTFEALVLIMGLVSMGYGIVTGDWSKALIGALVVGGAAGLLQLSKRWCKGIANREKRQE